jgi:SAM-dependent methyltransferase
MATDIQKLLSNLHRFYDFTGKTIISVGAGGGQLVEYAKSAKQVYAIDNDLKAIEMLKNRLELDKELKQKFTVVHADFFDIDIQADVVFFEFCLHEMSNPKEALRKARKLAPEVLVAEHGPCSEWAWVIEAGKVSKVWSVFEKSKLKRLQAHETTQVFNDYAELFNKVSVQGNVAVQRIEKYREMKPLTIPMQYVFALIH